METEMSNHILDDLTTENEIKYTWKNMENLITTVTYLSYLYSVPTSAWC